MHETQCLRLAISDLGAFGLLRPGASSVIAWREGGAELLSAPVHFSGHSVVLFPGAAQSLQIAITTTKPNFGGTRRWFLCPHCNRRCGVLWGAGGVFACGGCVGVRYASQASTALQRGLTRIRKRRERIGGKVGIFESFPPKPKNMHWATYDKLIEQDETDHAQLSGVVADFIQANA